MITEIRLRNGQQSEVKATGRYLMLKEGALVTAVVNGKPLVMPRGYVFDLEEEFTQFTITNLSDVESLEFLASPIPFNAGVDGSKLDINADLQIKDGLSVNFIGRQPVSLPDSQKVKAEITNLPPVMAVEVQNQQKNPDVQKVHVVQQSEPNLKFVAHDTMTATGKITGNAKRKELILKADAGNQASIWLGGFVGRGFEIEPASGFILSNGAEVEVLIPTNCKLYVSEVTA
ncbi:hypothetical protein [Vibrio panuliri]|uniref:Uncharacterized protein n=1 Tax=Vibrio panuliri TaxID=1381081 RepID=A0ABX3FJU2_9VIBR|nr:hypothetical protein [Vibrio panuliri]KAB1457405.1 hypothetical protein F7O85_06590 [Vibrio panuliri]OLQ91434.1 hypothetical protein BIY20_01090 [Vibrio panuliri]